MDKYLHIVSFNIPSPPNYGGIIDVYYKIKTLHRLGVKIILHCFEYERPPDPELETLCEKVYYYKRNTGWISNLTLLPYNVYSRKNSQLLENLLKDDYPILFEALHTCYYLTHPKLKGRIKIYRESNIEHDYYYHLARATKKRITKCFFYIEAWRYKRYEKVLDHADRMLVVSTADRDYLKQQFPEKQIDYMPSFHANEQVDIQPGKSDFILYHGKLSVVENEQAALYLIENVFSRISFHCIIAGMDPSPRLIEAASRFSYITVEANPSAERMDYLIAHAQVQLLITFQDTGLKLKLLNSLFKGRHIIVNHLMLAGTNLQSLCYVADTPEEMASGCTESMSLPITSETTQQREEILLPTYSNSYQGERLCQMIDEKQDE